MRATSQTPVAAGGICTGAIARHRTFRPCRHRAGRLDELPAGQWMGMARARCRRRPQLGLHRVPCPRARPWRDRPPSRIRLRAGGPVLELRLRSGHVMAGRPQPHPSRPAQRARRSRSALSQRREVSGLHGSRRDAVPQPPSQGQSVVRARFSSAMSTATSRQACCSLAAGRPATRAAAIPAWKGTEWRGRSS